MRQARLADAPILAAAEREIAKIPGRLVSRPDELHDDAFRKTIADLADGERGIYLVAEHEGAIVGHAFLEPLSVAAVAHVVRLTIAVHEGHQRRGVGRALLTELLRWARENPRIEKVELQVRSSNAPAIALYRSLGFIEEGRKTRRVKLAPNEYADDIYMALWVGPNLTSARPALRNIAPFFIVRAVTRALAFYRDQLGFEVAFQEPADAPFFALVCRGDAMLMLKSVGVEPLPNFKRHADARWDAYVSVPDPDALAAEFAARDLPFSSPLRDTHDGLRGFELADPDGHILFFGRPR